MTLYEIITQKIPFDWEKDNDTIPSYIKEGERPEFDVSLNEHPIVKNVIEPAWNTDPEVRPTASELVIKIQTLSSEDDTKIGLITNLSFGAFELIVDLMNLEQNNNWTHFTTKVWPEITHSKMRVLEQKGRMAKVLEEWGSQGGTISHLVQILKDLNRQDVLIELKEFGIFDS